MSSNPASTSLYAAIKLARLVQKAKDSLKSRIKKYMNAAKPQKTTSSTKLKSYDPAVVTRTLRSQSISDRGLGSRRTSLRDQGRDTDLSTLIGNLDIYVSRQELPLRVVAAHDSFFIKHDFNIAKTVRSLSTLYDVFDITDLLLSRLQNLQGRDALSRRVGSAQCGDFFCNKFIANLEHLLRCLKQIALDTIIRHYLGLVEAHILRWHDYWQSRSRIGEEWFAEWPNGQRPLSTTWPWNVKPSLLVLWGVCWMFYNPTGHRQGNQDIARMTRNQQGALPAAELSAEFRTRLQPTPQAPPAPSLSGAWHNSAINNVTHPNYSWLHPHQAGHDPRRATESILGTALPTYPASVSASPYISSTSTESSDLFATSSIQWPSSRGTSQDLPPASATSYTCWQPSPYDQIENITGTLTATPRSIASQTPTQPYALQRQAHPNLQAETGWSLSTLGSGFGFHLQGMQDYPSPHSNVSDQTASPCLSVLPGAMISPRMPVETSPNAVVVPSSGGSPESKQSSRKSVEPPRNAQGILYCADPACAQRPPVFARKCEWTKHMDKHTRPYICEEPECDNIRGFTYSGGLLRHQREVHRQHGGPKATCNCPHKDCKRSTGVGFSRKENLNEHLRRCHQPQQEDSKNSQGKKEDVSLRARKRRRNVDEDDRQEEKEEDSELQREVKKLRKEVAEKEERIKNLERWMEAFQRGQGQMK